MPLNTTHLRVRAHRLKGEWCTYVVVNNMVGFGRGPTFFEAVNDAVEDAQFYAGLARLTLASEMLGTPPQRVRS